MKQSDPTQSFLEFLIDIVKWMGSAVSFEELQKSKFPGKKILSHKATTAVTHRGF